MKPSAIIARVKSSDVARRMANGAFWSFTGTALGKFCVLLAGIFCARILGKELFGEFGMVRSTISTFIVLGTAGIGVTATRYISLYRSTEPDHIASIYLLSNRFAFITGLIVSLGILLCSGLLADGMLHSPHLVRSIQMGTLLLFISVLNGALNGTLVGMENFRAVAINTLIGSICESVFMLVGAYYWQVEGAVLGFGVGVIALFAANKLAVRRHFKAEGIRLRHQRIRRSDWRILITYSIPAALSALTITPVFWLIRSMLVRSNGYEALATFEAADQWKVIILFVPTAISQIALPILSSLLSNNKKFENVLMANIVLIAAVSTLIALAIILFSSTIMAFYGTAFTDRMPLVLLAVSTIFSSVSNVIEMSIYSQNKMWTSFGFNIVWAVLMVGFSYLFLRMGMAAAGLSMTVLLSYVCKTIYIAIYMKCIIRKAP